jgi:ABC-type multidrug transport system ATPase subunit/ABC-type transport system involved in multi-copper enzyme maturation permease subunit
MIRIENVSKRFGRRLALEGVSLQIVPGQITLLLGANGAGKSTLLRSILGIADFEGRILVNGLDPSTQGPEVRSLIGYMPQSGGLHADLTVDQTLHFHADIRQVPYDRAVTLAGEAGLAPHLEARVGDLSGGMRQRLGFAIALLTDPPILVLDEPSASLDAGSRAWVAARLRALANAGRTVLVSTHAGQELLGAAGRRIRLEAGRIVEAGAVEAKRFDNVPRSSAAAWRPAVAGPIARKEMRDAIRNRWVMAYAVLLGLLGLIAAATGFESSAGMALQTFGRTAATLMNLCLLLAPIVAVLSGASAIAGEQDRGTLENLLAQPLSRSRLLLAKYVGLLASLTTATIAGFVPAGLFVAWHTGGALITHYLLFPAIAAVLGAAMLGIGLFISASSRTAVQAQGTAVFVWFTVVLLYDLLIMGALAMSGVSVDVLAASLVMNPVDAARVLGLLALEPDLYLLGPAGAYLTARVGASGAALMLIASLAFWVAAPLAASVWRFRLASPVPRRRILSRNRRRPPVVRAAVHSAAAVPLIHTEEIPSS